MNRHLLEINRIAWPAARLTVWLTVLALLAGAPCKAPAEDATTTPSIQVLRDQMRQLQARREEREPLDQLVQLKSLMTSRDIEMAPGQASLRLHRELEAFNIVWIFDPVEVDGNARRIVVPQCSNGSQWINLEHGRWRLTLAFGRPDMLATWRLPPSEFQLVRERVYGINIGDAAEKALRTMEEQAARETEEKNPKATGDDQPRSSR